MGTIGFNRPTGKETVSELADMVASMQKMVEHLSRNINSKNVTEIGGWSVDMDRIASLDGDVGMSSAYGGLDDVRFWAGSTTPEIAPWRVYNSGYGVATRLKIQSSEDSYPRIVVDPAEDLFGAYASVDEYIKIGAYGDYGLSESPYIEFGAGSSKFSMNLNPFSMSLVSNVGLSIVSSGEIYLSDVNVNGWYDIRTPSSSIGDEINALQIQINDLYMNKSNVGHVHTVNIGSHNHGVSSGTSLAVSGGGSTTFVSSGGGSYTTSS